MHIFFIKFYLHTNECVHYVIDVNVMFNNEQQNCISYNILCKFCS